METREQPEQSTTPDQARGSEGGPDFGALILKYGEAMLRVGELEARVEELTRQLAENGSPVESGSSPGPSDANALEARVESLERVFRADSGEGADIAEADSTPAASQTESQTRDELGQLRLQIASLANQLAQAEDESREVRGHQSRRRRRKDLNKPWWRSLSGRLRQSRPQDL